MKKWQKFVAGGVAFLSVATLAACSGGKSSDTTTLKLWVPTGAKSSYASTIKAFEKENKGIKIDVKESNDSSAREVVSKDAGAATDVFSMPHDQLGQLVESKIIQEIPEKYVKEVSQNNVAQAVTGAQYKGKTYAFPFGVESQVLLYNKDKLSEEDVKSYETITSKAKFGTDLNEVNAYAIAPLMLSVGNTIFGPNGEDVKGTNWANDKGVAVMKWLAAQKQNSGFVNVPDKEVVSKFGNGTVDAIETGPWNYPDALKALGKDKIGVAAYPTVQIGGQTVQQKAFMGVKLYAVNQAPAKGDTKRIAAAYKLASYLTQKDSQANQFKTRSIVPSNKDVQASKEVTSDPLAKVVAQMTSSSDYTTVMPKVSQMATFWNSAAPLLSGPYSGKISEADYMSKLQQFDEDMASTK